MLKAIKLPTIEEFEASMDQAQCWAAVGYEESDINEIIKSVIANKKRPE